MSRRADLCLQGETADSKAVFRAFEEVMEPWAGLGRNTGSDAGLHLERLRVLEGKGVTHLRYRVLKEG